LFGCSGTEETGSTSPSDNAGAAASGDDKGDGKPKAQGMSVDNPNDKTGVILTPGTKARDDD
jgi:hypothetical protein